MFDFLKLLSRKKAMSIFVLGVITGLMSFLFLGFVNFMIGLILTEKNTSDSSYLILFCSLMLVLIWSRRALSYIVIKFSQQVFWKLRTEVLTTILKANFYKFSKRKDQIHAVLVTDINALTNFSLTIIQFLSSFIMTIGCFTYMGMQSRKLLLITLGVSVLGTILYWIGVHFNQKKLKLTRELENNFMRSLLDILSGFKEIHMNPKIGKDIFDRKINKISNESYVNNTQAYTGFLNVQITGEVLFYTLLAFILIWNSVFINEEPKSIVNFVFILLYLLGSINSLMLIIPTFVQAKVAAGRINKLKQELNDERFEELTENRKILINEFENLIVSDLTFSYENDKENSGDVFSIGPLNLSLKKGEAVFIYGDNGSGKTTMISTILGVLQGNSGMITFNGTELTTHNYGDYRTLFSIVFNDFHLFEEVYGVENVNENEVNDYLKLFELNGKITFQNNHFSSSNLSTGQRKRLALIIALIRLNPILVLDEWAADQDPVFRKKFYTQIIPELKNRGFSIIAITHDDAYYHNADKLYKMESGKLALESARKAIELEIAI